MILNFIHTYSIRITFIRGQLMIALKNCLVREPFNYGLRSKYVLTTEISFCHYIKLT